MKNKNLLLTVCAACCLAACSPKQSVVTVPVSSIDVEQLNKPLDYDMDVSALSISDLHILRNAPAAQRGFPFKDAYLRGIYSTTTWYDSLMWKFEDGVDFESVKMRDNEDWRDYYYRATDEVHALKYSDEEQSFMKRLEEREAALKKQNFDVDGDLLVNMQNLINPTQLTDFDSLLCLQLAQQGFAIVPAGHEQLFHVYEQNDYSCFPSFITTDLFLQLYHLYIDCMLRHVEEHTLLPLATDFSCDMYTQMHALSQQGETELLRRLAHHNAVYFSVACELLTGQAIGSAEERAEAQEEVRKVMASENDYSTFIGDYHSVMFPYSLFRPRGHYTRNEQLQRYFRGMMWLQGVPFGLDDPEQVQQAVVLASGLSRHAAAQRTYQRMNDLLTLLMGLPDNLSIPQVQAELTPIGTPLPQLLDDRQLMGQLKKTLDEKAEQQTRIRPKYERTSRNKVCLLPQRYQPDAEVLQEMVDYDTTPSLRPVPKGLDFLAALGVTAAEQILMEEAQPWQDFKPMLGKMKERMTEIPWQESIATQWMKTLQAVNDKDGQLPYFMNTGEWDKKNLNASLASWAELKHDAILYAKQPMGAECGGGGPPDPVTVGYVEPNVSFWKKAIALLDRTEQVLEEQGTPSTVARPSTAPLRETAQFLLTVSEKELAGEQLTDEEYDQISVMGAKFENMSLDLIREPDQYLMGWADVQGADRNIAIVADVYTANADNNPDKTILYEAVGPADEVYVVVEIEGYLYLTRGAVLSYREFTQPDGTQRLTDEEWQKKVKENPRKGVPEWMKSITVPLKKAPVPNEEVFYSSGC